MRALVAAAVSGVLFWSLTTVVRSDDAPATKTAAGIPGKGAKLKTQFGELTVFPPDNPWNQDVSKLPVHPNSKAYIEAIGLETELHPDFGTVLDEAKTPWGIPYVVVRGTQKKVDIEFDVKDESDDGPYPIPPNAPIEGGPKSEDDRHVLVVDFDNNKLYELYKAFPKGTGWKAECGAIFDLTSNRLRPHTWTSADAAGLPIFPGLVKYEEIEAGEILHALRFTVRKSQRAYIPPATHWASDYKDPSYAPMGLRLRLKASVDTTRFPKSAEIILNALKKYGMLMADNGGDLYISGAPHPKFRDAHIDLLKRIKAKDFEAVMTGELVTK